MANQQQGQRKQDQDVDMDRENQADDTRGMNADMDERDIGMKENQKDT